MTSTITINKINNINSLASGFIAGFATCSAKLALSPDSITSIFATQLCQRIIHHDKKDTEEAVENICLLAGILTRLIFLLILVTLNIMVIATFLNGMKESGSVIATALQTGANFTVSAAIGILVFSEKVNLVWVIGFAGVIYGLWLLASVSIKDEPF